MSANRAKRAAVVLQNRLRALPHAQHEDHCSYFSAQLTNKEANLFSDLAVHHMGSRLADDIIQGTAGPDEFRTAPLWGLGQRVFFLHDGRTQDLVEAIKQHASAGSEANGVIGQYKKLTESQKQDLLDFLRSL